ncbi:MAG: STAS domain-containing protein [Atopobiaceae bacterium]|nr:STAS domain-containing protein [Atopobiaceae bacterium]
MSHVIKRDGDSLTVQVFGRLDINTAPELEAELVPQLEGVSTLTIDLAQVNYVSSMGLRLLLSLQKRMAKQGSMVVTNVSPEVMELFEETGFAAILTIV